jgi:inner membrane protein
MYASVHNDAPMDNLCHTLVGAALGEAGLKRRTRFGNATLMIASNLPDLDVLAFATGTPSVALRRGWTHGVLAQALLPILLTAAVLAVARRRRRSSTPAGAGDPSTSLGAGDPPIRACELLLLAYIGVVLHVLMDLLNNYGVRLLMPFDRRWWYGDVLFIIDPWLWLVLGAGIWIARRRHWPKAARWSLAVASVYVVAMIISAGAARGAIIDRWRQVEGRAPQALMVGPVPVTPLRRDVIIDAGDHYETGTFTWRPRRVRFDQAQIPKNDGDPRVAVARDAPNIRAFLVWARFPFWTLEAVPGGTRVTVGDMRFAAGPGIARRNFTESVTVPDSRGP